jgi:hypothetical protein
VLGPIVACGAVCWDPYREGQVSALNGWKKRADEFANNVNVSGWETLAQRRLVALICTLFKAYTGRWAWKAIGNRFLKSWYLSGAIIIGKLKLGNKELMLVNIPS